MDDAGLEARLHRLREAIEGLLSYRPGLETLVKILRLQELLRKGLPLYRAVKDAGIGWKNYYKYAPAVYMDPGLLIPVPKSFLRDRMVLGVSGETLEQLRIAVNEVAKHAAWQVTRKRLLRGIIKRSQLGKEWLETAKHIVMAWIDEVVKDLISREARALK
jgi:hypothetical protein